MFDSIKSWFCSCDSDKSLKERQADAIAHDKEIRESLTEKQIDKELKDTMEASDPVAKY